MSKKNKASSNRRTFTAEFKAETVAHFRAGSRSIYEVARVLGIGEVS